MPKPQPKKIKDMLEAGAELPTSADLLREFMRLAGGQDKFAGLLWKSYNDRETSVAMKGTILNAILRGLKENEETDSPERRAEKLSDAELANHLRRLVSEVAPHISTEPSHADD